MQGSIRDLINYLFVFNVIKEALLALQFQHIIKASRGSARAPWDIEVDQTTEGQTDFRAETLIETFIKS